MLTLVDRDLKYLRMAALASPKPKRVQERLAASRFLAFSFLLHVVLVLAGGSVVLFKAYVEQPDFAATDGGLVSTDVVAQPPPEQPVDTQQTFTPEAPQIAAPTLSTLSTTNVSTPTFQVAASVPMSRPMQTDMMTENLQKATQSIKGIAGNIPGTMAGRMGGTSRAKMMAQNNGKQQSEDAVMRGLKWLVKTQNADGSWSPEHRISMTGLGLLAFLGHGETTTSAEFGPTVDKAINWLVKEGARFEGRLTGRNNFGDVGDYRSGGPPVYEHPIAAYALGEYYTMTQDDRVAPLLKQAIGHIVTGQAPNGGWGYGYGKEKVDLSVTGWHVQALKAAHLSGLEIPGVDAALERSMLYIKSLQRPDGGFDYEKKDDRKGVKGLGMTGVGVLCTYFWKQDKNDALIRDGVRYILNNDMPELEYKGPHADLYAWYYATQACLMYGGPSWTKWNRMFQDQVTNNQSMDGSWPPVTSKPEAGDLQRKTDGAGPFYRTTLSILMLEVFYRYAPTTKG